MRLAGYRTPTLGRKRIGSKTTDRGFPGTAQRISGNRDGGPRLNRVKSQRKNDEAQTLGDLV